jgi:hypothetical protein
MYLNLKKSVVGKCGLDSSGSGQGHMAALGFIKVGTCGI